MIEHRTARCAFPVEKLHLKRAGASLNVGDQQDLLDLSRVIASAFDVWARIPIVHLAPR